MRSKTDDLSPQRFCAAVVKTVVVGCSQATSRGISHQQWGICSLCGFVLERSVCPIADNAAFCPHGPPLARHRLHKQPFGARKVSWAISTRRNGHSQNTLHTSKNHLQNFGTMFHDLLVSAFQKHILVPRVLGGCARGSSGGGGGVRLYSAFNNEEQREGLWALELPESEEGPRVVSYFAPDRAKPPSSCRGCTATRRPIRRLRGGCQCQPRGQNCPPKRAQRGADPMKDSLVTGKRLSPGRSTRVGRAVQGWPAADQICGGQPSHFLHVVFGLFFFFDGDNSRPVASPSPKPRCSVLAGSAWNAPNLYCQICQG